MKLNEYGSIAYNEWMKLPQRFTNIELDVFQVMPNHIHGILVLNDVGAPLAGAPATQAATGPGAAPVGDIIGTYKSLVSNACLKIFKSKNQIMGKLWQRDYYEHIIRNEQSYRVISDYIVENPANWGNDRFFKIG